MDVGAKAGALRRTALARALTMPHNDYFSIPFFIGVAALAWLAWRGWWYKPYVRTIMWAIVALLLVGFLLQFALNALERG